MANPWEIDWANQQAPAPQGMSGGIVIRPGDPNKATLTQLEIEAKRRNAVRDQQIIDDTNYNKAHRGLPVLPVGYRWKNGVVNGEAEPIPGTNKSDDVENKTPEELQAVRFEALQKIALARSLRDRSKNQYFATGIGAGLASSIRGTGAYDVRQDTETLKNAGALQRILEMAKTNGGKNPLTPLSNSDFQALASSLANLDTGQSDEQYQRNVGAVEDLYRRAYDAAGGTDLEADLSSINGKSDDREGIPGYTPPTGAPPSEGGNGIPTLSPSQEAEIKKLAPTMTPQAMQKWFKDRRMPISTANAQGIYDYYRKEGPNAPPPSFAYDDSKYNAYLDERNAAQDAQFGKEGNYSLGVNQLMAGVAPLIAGATQGVGSALRGEGFAPGYQIGRDQSMRRFQQARDAAGIPGMVSEGLGMAGGMLATGAATGAQKFLPRLGADMLFGATSGAIQAKPGEETQGALQGSLGAGLGNVGGHVVGTGLGKALTGARDVGVDYLRARSVPLTIGQALGGKWKAREDKLTSFLPSIGERRAEGLSAFRDAAYEDMGAPVGYKPSQLGMNGNAVMDESRLAVGPAYDAATAGRMFDANEPQFVQGAGQALAQGRAIPGELGDRFAGMEKARVAPFIDEQGGLSGPNFQAILRGVRKETSSALPEPRGDLFADASRALQGELRGLVERQAPDVLPKFDAANQFYQNRSILRDAVTAAKNTNGDWLPSQLGNAVNANVRKFGGKDLAASESRPFYELQKHGQNILPSKIADSGTAGRLGALAPLALPAIGVGTGGATGYAGGDTGAGTATGLGTALTMAMLSTKAGQKAAVKLLVGRPDKMIGMGQKLLSKRAVASALGGGSLGAALIGRQ